MENFVEFIKTLDLINNALKSNEIPISHTKFYLIKTAILKYMAEEGYLTDIHFEKNEQSGQNFAAMTFVIDGQQFSFHQTGYCAWQKFLKSKTVEYRGYQKGIPQKHDSKEIELMFNYFISFIQNNSEVLKYITFSDLLKVLPIIYKGMILDKVKVSKGILSETKKVKGLKIKYCGQTVTVRRNNFYNNWKEIIDLLINTK